MKRLNAKQILALPIGKYHDGNGLNEAIEEKKKDRGFLGHKPKKDK